MFTNLSLINIFFKCSIFLILIYKIYDLIKNHIPAYLVEQVILTKNRQLQIFEKEKLLTTASFRLENEIFHQKEMFISLEKKMQYWQELMIQFKNEQDQKNNVLLKRLKEKRSLQHSNITNQKNMESVLPKALIAARRELMIKYQGVEGKVLLEKIMCNIIATS